MADLESWQCQRCGAPIGWLGHFMRGLFGRSLYARLIGCRASPCGGRAPAACPIGVNAPGLCPDASCATCVEGHGPASGVALRIPGTRPLIEIARELLADPEFAQIMRNLKDHPIDGMTSAQHHNKD